MSGYLLDTHVWYWLLGALDTVLRRRDRDLLEAASTRGELYLSAMSIWETAQKEANGKLRLRPTLEAMMDDSFLDGSIRLIGLSTEVLIAANRLPGDIHGDPVDRILAATARLQDLTLITHDALLVRYSEQGRLRVHKV